MLVTTQRHVVEPPKVVVSRWLFATAVLTVLATPTIADDLLFYSLGNFWRERFGVGHPPSGVGEMFGAERSSQEDDIPRIPEPMVFDLVRPLGVRRGEFEINTLMLMPLSRTRRGTATLPDPLGLVPRSLDRSSIEWAPEIEWAPMDNLAIEFELPFERGTLEAYKLAGQATFGTLFDQTAVHGGQMIVMYDRHAGITTPTFLYILGVRMDPTWSFLGMVGMRTELGATSPVNERTESLLNLSWFADLTPRLTFGVESNYAGALDGQSTLFLIPQIHWEVTDHSMLQWGVGVDFTTDFTLPEFGARYIISR